MKVAVEPHGGLAGTRALLVDRDADTRQMYGEFLRLHGQVIDEADDGREALAKALSGHPDLVVTETRLPGINGVDLCRLLRDDPATHDIGIVFVTGDGQDRDVQRAEAAGADRVLVKPCLPELLAVEIEMVLRRSRELRERSRRAHAALGERLTAMDALVERSRSNVRRVAMSRALERRDTTSPPLPPPTPTCPMCDHALSYTKSHVGGVSARHQEQWDYFECHHGCGTFQYRQRTRKLRRVQ